MGILKNLLVLGSAKFVNVIKGTVEHAQNGIYFGHCATAAATADKVVELDDPTGFTLRNGVMICVTFDATNSASNVTFNVEGTGAKAVSQVENTAYTDTSTTITGHTSYYTYYVYNGTYWCFVNYSENTTNNVNTVPSAQCDTAADTAAKAATCTYYTLKDDSYLHVNIRNANTAASALTFNVNSRGAKPLYINGSPSSSTNYTLPAGTYIAFYDGTNWNFRTDDKLPANIIGDAGTVNSHTVEKDVPSNAVFTDTKSTWYGTCSTAASTAAKIVTTVNEDFVLATGSMIRVKFTNNDTYNGTSTLNVDGTGAIDIMGNGTTAKARYHWTSGEVVDFVYDGTNYTMVDGGIASTTYYGVTKLSSATNSTSTGMAATASAVKKAYDLAAEAKDAVDALDFGTVGSEGNPVYFDDGSPVAGTFSWGVDSDQNVQVGWDGDAPEIVIPTSTALPINQGGTGATTAAEARTNLGLGTASTYNVVSTVNNDDDLVTGAAIKNYYEAVGIPSAICTTVGETSAKVASCSSYKLLANSYIQVILSNSNSSAGGISLNINSTGAKPVFINGTISSSDNKTLPAGSYIVFYDGSNYYFRTDGKLPGSISGDAGTVNSHTVEKDVPSNAAFTDTTDLTQMTGTLLIGNGGTGATTAEAARTNLGLGNAATCSVANNLTTSSSGKVLDARMGLELSTTISNKFRSYSTETLAAFYTNVVSDGFELFIGTSVFTSKLSSSTATGICYGFAVNQSANSMIEGIMYNTNGSKLFAFRINSSGTMTYNKMTTLSSV